jgi:hypothetical protein
MDAITDHYPRLNTTFVHDHAKALTINANNFDKCHSSKLADRIAVLLSINSVEEYFFQINKYFMDAAALGIFDTASKLLKESKALSLIIQEIILNADHLTAPLNLAVRYCSIVDNCEAIVYEEILPARQLKNSAITPKPPNTDHEQPLL